METHQPPVRVLHVVSSTDRRGAETAAVELSEALGPLGLPGEVLALAPGMQGGLDVPALGRSRYDRAALLGLRRRAAESSVVVAHGSSTLPAAAGALLGLNTPFVYRSIGDPADWLTTASRRARVRWAIRRASAVVALWRGAAVTWHRMLGVRPERITVIPNGVSGQRFLPPDERRRAASRLALGLPSQGHVVVYLGALSPEKRIDLAIRAVGSMEGVTLAVIGDGPERDRLQAQAASSNGGVRVCGPTREPWNALAAADVLVLPSDTEGQPAVAIEAGLMGLPVVATRVGGLPDVVLDGCTGVLVERDDPASLTAALRQVLDGPEPYGENARRHCLAGFELEPVTRKWAHFLQSVIKIGAISEQHRG